MHRPLLLSLIFLFPSVTQASIYISEVAWMGTTESYDHEWIELHNTGSAVSVDGWTIVDSNNLSIELEGTVPANSYVVLERISDASAPGGAFLIYNGSLVNGGTTLSLNNNDGTLIDRVSGGEDWQNIGGDNDTKATAQYTSSGWITAEATPGKAPVASSQSETQEDNQTNQATNTSSNSGRVAEPASNGESAEPLELPPVGLQLNIDAPDTGYINQPIEFDVDPSGIGDTLIASLSYQWNFGDGNTSNKESPVHLFRYPGTYVVNVHASYKRQESLARHEITILPVNLSLTQNSDGDIQINNDSSYEIDISGYKLNSRDDFTFPPHSIILPNQTITINRSQIKHDDNLMLAIYDNDGEMLNTVVPDNLIAYADTSEDNTDANSVTVAAPPTSSQNSDFTFTSQTNTEPLSDQDETEPNNRRATDSPAVASAVSSGIDINENWTYLALLFIILIASVGILIKPNSN